MFLTPFSPGRARHPDAAAGTTAAARWRRGQRRRLGPPGLGGPTTGLSDGPAPALRLLVLSESTVAGVGAASHAEGLAGQVALALAGRLGRAVAWSAVGQSGASATEARDLLVPQLPAEPADALLVALGVNDCLRFRSPGRWAADLAGLIAAIRARVGHTPLFLAGVPPMGRFPALPQPLRGALGLRARLLDAAAARLAVRLADVTHLPSALPLAPALFCADGFHPDPAGYQAWGALLAEGIAHELARR